MIALWKNAPAFSSHSDRYAQALLQSYLQKSQEQQPALRISSVWAPASPAYRLPRITFGVGREKLYVVKNIRDFLNNVNLRRTESYGKGLTLDHSMEQFDARSQAMIELLMNEFSQFRSMSGSLYSRYESGDEKNRITLTGDSFDRWFDLLEGEPLEAEWGNNLRLLREDPQVGIRVEKQGDSVLLEIKTPCNYRFFGSRKSLYALSENILQRCSPAFREKVYPLLEQGQSLCALP